MKIYIAGPMTGYPSFNFPAFDMAAHDLRKRGFEVFSPAEMDDEVTRAAIVASPDGAPVGRPQFAAFMARDLTLIIAGGIEAVYVLPGWDQSPGAKLETFTAKLLGLPVVDYATMSLVSKVRLLVAWGDVR